MKRMIVLLLFFASSTVFSLSGYSDIELIKMVDVLVSESLERLEKMGNLGEEKIEGALAGEMNYSTKLTGFNKVLSIIEFNDFQDFQLNITGTIINEVNWIGSGISQSEFHISGIEDFYLKMEMKLENKVPVEGHYYITRKGSIQGMYPFDVLSSE